MLLAPPVSVLLDHEVIETSMVTSDGTMNKKSSYIDQSLFSLSCAIDSDGPLLLPLDVTVKLNSPTSFPQRTNVSLSRFSPPSLSDNDGVETNGDLNGRPAKRQKHAMNGDAKNSSSEMDDAMVEVSKLSELLAIAIESKSEE